MKASDKKKRIIIIFAILCIIFIYIIISAIVGNNSGKNSNSDETTVSDYDRKSYEFSETIDLEVASGVNEETKSTTDQVDLGVISDFYKDVDIERVGGDTIIMETPSGGYMTITACWMDDGLAKEIIEPDFGSIQKFFLNPDGSIIAIYDGASMKDMTKYMNQLSAIGFNEVTLDNQDKKKDLYYYAAKNKDGKSVNLVYEDGSFKVCVFN